MARITNAGLKQILAAQNGESYIVRNLENWLVQTQGEWVVSQEAMDWVAHQLTAPGRNRTASFSASGISQCQRKQVYQYMAAPAQKEVNTHLWHIFFDGHWRHARLQAAMYEAGVLTDLWTQAEVALKYGHWRGTKDTDNGTFIGEIKGVHDQGFKYALHKGVTWSHLMQGAAYVALTDKTSIVSFLYENKNTQDMKELVVDYSNPGTCQAAKPAHVESAYDEVELLIDALPQYIADKEIPKALPSMKEGGAPCKRCPFLVTCQQDGEDKTSSHWLATTSEKPKKRVVRRPANKTTTGKPSTTKAEARVKKRLGGS